MPFRSSRRDLRSVSTPIQTIHISVHARLDALEGRVLMSSVVSGGTACTCAACMAAAASAASANTAVSQATIKPLKAITKATSAALKAAGANLFSGTSTFGNAANGIADHIGITSATPFTLDLAGIKSKLAKAPAEFTQGAQDIPVVLALPKPDGTLTRFKVVRSEVMDPALARQFPDIRTYRGIGIDDPTADVRLDTTAAGFHAQVLTTDGAYYIDPYFLNDANGSYVSYFQADAVKNNSWSCTVAPALTEVSRSTAKEIDSDAPDSILELSDGTVTPASITFGGTLKTYRAAVGANHQYVAAATTGMAGGATVANAQAQIVTAMNRVTGVYESELSIRMTLVASNSSIIYAAAAGDPWTSNSTSILDNSTSTISSVIGVSNYDIGHVFSTGSGGVAGLGVVGKDASKGRGTTGSPSPLGDGYYIDYVAHEMGHQFGANHTFNTSGDTGNRVSSRAYEPGSGLSIMAYAGIEGADDLAGHSIAYFHSASIDEIRNYIATIPAVGTSTANGDTAPTVNAGADYVIPTATPFALTATGSDVDGDTLTYDWQERDLGAATLLSTADNGASPLFTEITPSTNPTRTLPRLNSVLGGFLNTVAGGTGAAAANVLGAGSNTTTARLAERMYAVARTASNWRVTARDNHGGLSTDDMALKVVNTGAAFAITSYPTAVVVTGGSTPTLAWNVAGTDANGINTANVKISLSTDGGQTFPTVLAASTANDGSEPIQIPYGLGTSTARIKVEAIGNIFFDINNANLTITNVAAPVSAVPGAPLLAAASDTGVSSSDGITQNNNVSAGTALTFSVPGTVAGALVEIIADNVVIGSATATGTTTIVTTNGLTLLVDGTRPVTARQTETGKPVSAQSAGTSITVDTVAPTLTALADRFGFEDAQTLSYQFNGVDASTVTTGDVSVLAPDTSTIVPAVSYDSGTGTATFSFGSLLADGDYAATLNAGAVTDTAGNAVAAESVPFFVLAGDANRNRTVDFQDLVALSQNYNLTGKSFSQGDFNYSGDGVVDFQDLVILSQQYNKTLPSLRPAAASLVGGTGTAKTRIKKPVADGVLA
jgi:hypothetical protein